MPATLDRAVDIKGPENRIPYRRRYGNRLPADVLVWHKDEHCAVEFYHHGKNAPMWFTTRDCGFDVESLEYVLEELADRPDLEVKNLWYRPLAGELRTLVSSDS